MGKKTPYKDPYVGKLGEGMRIGPPKPSKLKTEAHSYDHNRPMRQVVSRYGK